MTRVGKAVRGLLVALVALAATEGLLRVFVPADRLLFEWERPTGLIGTTPDGAVVTRPGMAEDRDDGPYRWTVRLNALGLREDAEVPAKKPPGTYRILALGDSWIFGFSVSQGHTISDHLETLLPARLGVEHVEVINAGVFGSCAFDMLARYRSLVDALEIDGVLLGQPHNSSRQDKVGDTRARWYRTAVDGPASDARLYLLARRLLAPLRAGHYAVPDTGNAQNTQILDLRTLIADAHRRGLPVWFAELPNDMAGALHGFAADPSWRTSLSQDGVPIGGHSLPERACWGFRDIGHPSAAGAAVIADAVAEVIATNKSLPAMRNTPSCADAGEPGPGLPGWAWSQ